MSALGRGEAWAKAYRDRARHPEMGEAHGYALEVFRAVEAVIVAGHSKDGIEALAGALAEYRARETERARAEAQAEARAWYNGALVRAVRAALDLASKKSTEGP